MPFIALSLLLVAPDFARFEKVLLAEMRELQVPGIAVAIVHGNKVVFSKGYGIKSVETREKVKPTTFFRIASTTKMLTAAALVSAYDKQGLDLRTPVSGFVKDLDPTVGRITAHQLLTHTSGLLDASDDRPAPDEDAPIAWSKTLNRNSFFAEPGEVYSYANPGFQLAGVTLAGATKLRYADAMSRELFEPLGMKRSTFRPTMAMTYDLALGHDEEDGMHVVRPMLDSPTRWPSGGLYSNVFEMSRFCIALMNGGKVPNAPGLTPAVVAKLLTPNPETKIGPIPKWYSYGLNVTDERGIRIVQHAGGTTGYGSFVLMVPKEKIAMVLMANLSTAILPKTNQAAIDLFLKRPPAPAPRKPLAWAEGERAKYVGKYKNGGLEISLVESGKELLADFGDDKFKVTKLGSDLLTLKHGNPDLEGTIYAADLPFKFDAAGRASFMSFLGRALKRVDGG